MDPVTTSMALTVFSQLILMGFGFLAGAVVVDKIEDCCKKDKAKQENGLGIPEKKQLRNRKPFANDVRYHSV